MFAFHQVSFSIKPLIEIIACMHKEESKNGTEINIGEENSKEVEELCYVSNQITTNGKCLKTSNKK